MGILKSLAESFLFAFGALKVNRLRTFLSLLGITIGIFTITAVFTTVDTLKNIVKNSINKLGNNIVYIQKFPWTFGDDYPWWKYIQRPMPTLLEASALQTKLGGMIYSSFVVNVENKTVKYQNNSVEEVEVVAHTAPYNQIVSLDFQKGRYFSQSEFQSGKNLCLLGYAVANGLFKTSSNPIGKTIALSGHPVEVVGVLAKQGEDLFGLSTDKNVFIPVNFARNIADIKSKNYNMIFVKGTGYQDFDEMEAGIRSAMRSIRKLPPGRDDNFALNNPSIVANAFESTSHILDIVGIVIGGFSILVGGFGIANIMFVSVKERTVVIGIQKALGAKNYFILFQFLIEAILLCLIGGLIGLVLVYLSVLVLSHVADMTIVLTLKNLLTGIFLSVAIGTISGLWPAMAAARMDPVEAIRAS